MKVFRTAILIGLLMFNFVSAYEVTESNCAEKPLDDYCANVSKEDCDKVLNECLKIFEQKAKIFEAGANQKAAEKASLSAEIDTIQHRINTISNEIKKNTVIIKDLGVQVESTKSSITESQLKIQNTIGRLKDILISIYKEDNKSGLEYLFSGKNLTESIESFIGFKTLSQSNQNILASVIDLKQYLEDQKEKLSKQKDNLEEVVSEKEVQQNQELSLREEKDKILEVTKGQEALYKTYQQQAEVKIATIKARIFNLAGMSDVTEAPSFGEAIEIAKIAGNTVGVRPAFILAILAQETRIGKNVGKCYITGAHGLGASGTPVMRPNQAEVFVQITQAAGLDYTQVPVSCPIPSMGCTYGGAMGPAQFMPTTWNLFKEQIQAHVGHAPNPWNIRDAFFAAALFVKDAGADSYGNGELKAASRYFGSGAYGYQNQVQVRAACIETFMKQGTMSANCEAMIF